MLNITGRLKVFLAVEPADMRKSFNGLYSLAVEKLGEDPIREPCSPSPISAGTG